MSGPVVAGVAETNGDTADRQLHRLGSDLTQDRVGAGPDVGHRQLDHQPAIVFQPGKRRRALQHVAADRGSDPETNKPSPRGRWPGLRGACPSRTGRHPRATLR